MTLKTGICPACGSKEKAIEEHLWMQGAPAGMDKNESIYVDALSCKSCGFMELYRKGPLGAW